MVDVKKPWLVPTEPKHWSHALQNAVPKTPATAASTPSDTLLAFMNSPAGASLVRRLNSPTVAFKPLVEIDPLVAGSVSQALKQLPPAPVAAKPKRQPRRVAKPSKAPAAEAEVQVGEFVVVRNTARRPARVPASAVTPLVTHDLALQQTVAGAGFGTLAGAGIAHILNSLKHVEPTGAGAVLFDLAGALVGCGVGGLIGSRVVKPTGVTVPGLKLSFKTD